MNANQNPKRIDEPSEQGVPLERDAHPISANELGQRLRATPVSEELRWRLQAVPYQASKRASSRSQQQHHESIVKLSHLSPLYWYRQLNRTARPLALSLATVAGLVITIELPTACCETRKTRRTRRIQAALLSRPSLPSSMRIMAFERTPNRLGRTHNRRTHQRRIRSLAD